MTTKNMHIAINGSMLDDQPTGVGVYSFNVINSLSNLLFEEKKNPLTVFTPTKSNINDNLRVIRLSKYLLSSRYGKLAALCRFIWNTFFYPFKARQFDLLLSPTSHGSFLLRNQVITIHDLISLKFPNISAHQRFYFKYFLPFIVSRARLIIAVSETTKKDIIHFLKCPEEKIKVVYNGYDDARYKLCRENSDLIYKQYNVSNYILAVGPTYAHKNFELLLQAYAELDEATKQAHPLLIAGGKKKYLSTLQMLVSESGLEKFVSFIGYVPFDLMPSLYREATCMVFPSLHEGFGIPLLEAMACGCPVIVSDASSMPEVCGNAAMYFNPYSRQSLVECIGTVISDGEVRDQLIDKGLKQATKFSWNLTANKIKTILEKDIH